MFSYVFINCYELRAKKKPAETASYFNCLFLVLFLLEERKKNGRRLTLPPIGSTISAEGLNFSVRNGKRWIPFAIATLILSGLSCDPLITTKYIFITIFEKVDSKSSLYSFKLVKNKQESAEKRICN